MALRWRATSRFIRSAGERGRTLRTWRRAVFLRTRQSRSAGSGGRGAKEQTAEGIDDRAQWLGGRKAANPGGHGADRPPRPPSCVPSPASALSGPPPKALDSATPGASPTPQPPTDHRAWCPPNTTRPESTVAEASASAEKAGSSSAKPSSSSAKDSPATNPTSPPTVAASSTSGRSPKTDRSRPQTGSRRKQPGPTSNQL